MKKFFSILVVCYTGFNSFAQDKIPSQVVQIKNALLAAPSNKKDGVAVYGFSASKEFVLLRKGSNEFICLADDPDLPSFSVACYHRSLEPFMKRGRDLKKQGKPIGEIFDMREKEVKAGTLAMPKQPTALYVYSALKEVYDSATGVVKNGSLRSVVYIPYATAESTGLPLKPEAPGMPWIMHPGTHGAHIIITPPKSNQ